MCEKQFLVPNIAKWFLRRPRPTAQKDANARRGPADARRYTLSERSVIRLRRAQPRLHSLYQSIREANTVESCAGSAVA